ncbi:UNVERIFIED_CONTAM: Cyclic dof factor 2 [Sesamum latifolium]|uniref:Cyclic dof factor 2 n=1 Tax=Sesamum latifolium TaxID=2727402 RepID=A0AAW2Y774_9LAMI
MFEVKDPKIKLFGKTIELPETCAAAVEIGEAAHSCDAAGEDSSNQDPSCSSDSVIDNSNLNGDAEDQESHKCQSVPEQNDAKEEDVAHPSTSNELKEDATRPANEDSKALSADSDARAVQTSKTDDDQSETAQTFLQEMPEVLDGWWTMRNVPVGAGRRKNKSSASQFCHLTVPESLQSARVDLPNGVHHPVLNPNGTILAFSSDAPLCESMVSVLNITDKTLRDGARNGFQKPAENGDDQSSGSSTSAASSKDEVGQIRLPELIPNHHPFPPQLSSAVLLLSTTLLGLCCARCLECSLDHTISTNFFTEPHFSKFQPQFPALGKHSRDDNILKPANSEEETRRESNSGKCLWVPKTLRIDDPGEAAKSSIWATLGIKNDRVDPVGGGGLFKAFGSQSKGDCKAQAPETSTVLQANPAALSRSLSFHESS